MILKILLITAAVILAALLFFWKFIFLRDPARIAPEGKVIVAPCDGKVVKVLKFTKKQLRIQKGVLGKVYTLADEVGEEGTLVSIFMSPLDVHYTRSPHEGTVLSLMHSPGKFLPVFDLEAGLQNENVEILMEDKSVGKFKVILMAGFLARRIIPFVNVGQYLKKGECNGLINLGSQVTILFGKKVNIHLKEGQRVLAGETIIGRY